MRIVSFWRRRSRKMLALMLREPTTGQNALGRAAGKHKAREPADLRIGHELAKPVERKSRKVSFHLGEFTSETSSSDRVSWVWSNGCVFCFER